MDGSRTTRRRTRRWATLLVAGGLAAATGVPSGGPAAAAVSPDLVLFYAFTAGSGTSVVDSSNARLHGTLTNADPSTAYVPGRAGYGRALQLVGRQRQYVAVPEHPALDVNRFTVAALVRYTGVQNPDTHGRWEVLEKAGAYWVNVRTNGRVRVGGFFGGCTSSRFWKYVDSTRTVRTGTWTHVTSTYNGSRLRVYVDGVAAGGVDVTGRTCSNDEPLAVGAKNAPAVNGLEAFWDGRLDDVRVYDRALTPTEVANLAP